MENKTKQLALRVSLIYCLVAGVWCLLSDRVLIAFVSNPEAIIHIDIIKDWVFAAVTALMLYVVLRSQLRRWERDVIARKVSETALEESEQQYRSLFENMLNGFAFCRMHFNGDRPQDFTYLKVNPAFEALTGLKNVQGRKATEVIPGIREADAALFEKYGRVARTGVPEQFEVYVEALKMWFAIAVYSPKKEHFVAVFDVITKRKQAEAALQESENKFRQVVENIDEVFWMADVDLNQMLYISPSYERIWGRSCASLIENPRSFLDAVHAEDRDRVVANLAIEKTGQPFTIEYRIIHPDGTTRWIRDRGFPVRSEQEKVTCYVGVAQDITKNRNLEEQLRQAQKMESIGLLAGGVAHDFNNILTVIQMEADMMKADASLSPNQLDSAKQIGAAAERAAILTRQLLLFSRKKELEPRDLELNESINNMTRMLRRTIGEDIQLQFRFNMQPLFIHADPGLVDQVLMNLVVNSRDAMPKGGRLIIETSAAEFNEADAAHSRQVRPGKFVCLSVSDTGCGIPRENLARIFEPFFTTEEVGKGTGLGLATVFGIVQQHNGWVNAYSEVGHGRHSAFIFRD